MFQLDVESFHLKFQFEFGVLNESNNFLMNLQNSSLGITALLMVSGVQKSLSSEKLVCLEFEKSD